MSVTSSHATHVAFVTAISDQEQYISFPDKMWPRFQKGIKTYTALSDKDPIAAIEQWLGDTNFPANQMTSSGISSLRSLLKDCQASGLSRTSPSEQSQDSSACLLYPVKASRLKVVGMP